jgi:hypothetical protein
MVLKIILLLNLILYSIVAGQSFMYIIAMRNVTESLDAASYIRMRKLLDKNFLRKFQPVMYAALLCGVPLVICSILYGSVLMRTGAVFALAALLTDAMIALKGNMPVNRIINNWSEKDYPADWDHYRQRWQFFYSRRQTANISGFICLLIIALFG